MKEKLNLQTLLVWSSFPGVPHEAAMDSITMFTEQVMPLFTEAPGSGDAAPAGADIGTG
jgi:hypothetical protein